MKKYLIATVAFLAVVSCAKEAQAPVQNPVEGKQITISATIPAEGLTKVDLAEDGGYTAGLKLTWKAGDKITVTDAANPANTQEFTLSGGEGTASGTFTGTALAAASAYDIAYDDFGTSFNFAEQTQATDGSTDHLKYAATLSGVTDYTSFTFSEAWATANSATYASSSALRLRADIPFNLEDVQAVYIKSDQAIFNGGKEIKVNITTPADEGETDILTVYAALPAGDVAIPAGTGLVVQFQVSDKAYDKYTSYRTLGAMTLKSGKVNSIGLDCNTDQDITKYANKVLDDIGTVDNPYIIGDQHQMDALHDELASGTNYIKVVDDIDLTGIDWEPLNYEGTYDKGVNFDGGNHTIANLSVGTSYNYPSFFGVVNGTVKDVTFESPAITGGSYNTGVVGGYIGTGSYNGTCSGITVSNATVSVTVDASAKGRNVGVFAGQIGTNGSSITDCHVSGVTSVLNTTPSSASSASNAGGFVGFTDKTASITDCTVSGTVTVTMSTTKTGCSVGGFIGNAGAAATFERCTAAADVSNPSSYYTGGFVGQVGAATAARFIDCAFLGGELTAGRNSVANSPVGGFVGRVTTNAGASFTGCYVDGAHITATTSGRCGGFLGDGGTGATANTFTSCYVKNSTVSAAQHAGGFAGTLYGVASKCYVESTTITANNDNAGGFVGFLENGKATNCYTSATVIGGTYANIGGFVGQQKNGGNVTGEVKYCFANGTVSGSATSVGAFIGGVTAVPTSVTKNIAWNGSLPLVGSDGGLDISTAITDNYFGTSGTISSQATTLGWDTDIWDLSGSVPTLK